MPHPTLAHPLHTREQLTTLVENRTVYSLDAFELNVFETHRVAEQVPLSMGHLVLTTMLRGKKVMHLPGRPAFDYLPGESVLVGEDQTMVIDFPEATEDAPTQCLAVAIPTDTIRHTVDLLNEEYPHAEAHLPWHLDTTEHAHLTNSPELTGTLERLVQLSRDTGRVKDVLANFTIQEMLVRLMQTQARQLLFHNYARHATSHRFAAVVQYIKQHLADKLTIDKLSNLACMSKATFFRVFRQELGITPVEYINQERLAEAKRLLRQPLTSVADVCYRVGFTSTAYFQRLFKQAEGLTPGAYRKRCL
ncbi:AraC family transcriptional regulator [Hymenobacter aerilatus]|uniref:AraC family transcriptional regulator n=1 Tax=Hymenobacter aerilatus TaxID=2932251 RepID=A0A8T9SQJ4_9BACT|nr:AraC family transcriptional regulator [Hymenobacter aerilatus]UOR04075.1 AraC family transcriptional regulator [Hymenobacter aerilatus]